MPNNPFIMGLYLALTTSSADGFRHSHAGLAHHEAFYIAGLQFPKDAVKAAGDQYPGDHRIESVFPTPSDTHSLLSLMNRMLGFGYMSIAGAKR